MRLDREKESMFDQNLQKKGEEELWENGQFKELYP